MAEPQQLRAKHTTFTYQAYSWELLPNNDFKKSGLKISFSYQISPDILFNPTVTIHGVTSDMIHQLGKDVIDAYVFQIGLSEMYSYWKVTASPNIVIQAGIMNTEALDFWHKLLLKGMGEFFYVNKIDFSAKDFVSFTVESQKEHTSRHSDLKINIRSNRKTNQPKVLIPIGGGKDSCVTLELLKHDFEVGTYIVSTPKSAQDVIDISKIPQENQIKITRTLDPKLFELNENGYLNGHVPISSYLAFVSLLTADLFGYSHIAISNERSSNEGNVWYCDQEINHQYSKSYEFERDLQTYVATYLPETAPLYFSFLRPLYELQIAQLFSQLTDHHPVFRSCNRGQKQNIWCGNCSKCLFAWTILFPFLGPEKLSTYFGLNLFDNKQLWPIAQELLGLSKAKPFDCVGTHEETILAFYLSAHYYKNNSQPLPPLLERINHELETNPKLKQGPTGETNYETRVNSLLTDWNPHNSLPTMFVNVLQKTLDRIKNNKE